MNVDPDPATSTNSDIYVVPIDGGDVKKITTGPGADNTPLYSPDGKFLAFRSQARGGYESDRWRLMELDRATGRATSLTENLDRWVGSVTWSPDSTRIFFTVEDRGRTGLQMIQATGGGSRNIIAGASTLDDVQFTSDGRTMIYTEVSGSHPTEIYRATSNGGTGVALTHLNDAVLANAALTPLEEMFADSSDKTRVHAFIVKPPDFSPTKKYPVLFLIHGGPQGSWGESWTYRWNAQVFAGAGYLVVMPNPRGSTGYGQKYTEEISGDWGGKAYDDIMAVVDSVAALPYVDPARMAAAGGSYGGYMIDWMLGHTDRFKAFVTHDGVFDLRSMAAETEELWFVQWEFKGMPWDNPELVRQVVSELLRQGFQDAHAGDPRRAGFPGSRGPGDPVVHRVAVAESAFQAPAVSRRRPLGPEAAEHGAVVFAVSGLDRPVDQSAAVGFLLLSCLLTRMLCSSLEARLRTDARYRRRPGVIRLPQGELKISSELTLAPGAHDLEIVGNETRLKAADNFKGRAILVIENAERIHLHDFEIDGNREKLAKPLEMAPPENAFRVWYPDNGVLANKVAGLEIEQLRLERTWSISRSWSASRRRFASERRRSKTRARRTRAAAII